ncbi:MAG: hypothetical protein J7L98_06535 [Candidatus Verstraetearchaeota archaeon]|nr:hypothetical protein [Candidatus Verstraetearchaeota archaeon]
MFLPTTTEGEVPIHILSPVQQVILKTCLERGGSVSLSELKEEIEKVVKYRPVAALSQNSKALEHRGYIYRTSERRRITIHVNPAYAEPLRKVLGLEAPKALLSGYSLRDGGELELTFQETLKKLNAEGVSVGYVYCFTTPEASAKLKEKPFNEEKPLPLDVYSKDPEKLREEIMAVIDQLVLKYTVILDITPLTKLFADVLAEASATYKLPRVFVTPEKLVWLRPL